MDRWLIEGRRDRDPESERDPESHRDAATVAGDAAQAAEEFAGSPPVRVLGRIGLVAYGGVNLVIAALAVQIGLGDGERADKTGALQAVAATGSGLVALWIAVVGLAALVVWQVADVVFPPRGLPTGRRLLRAALDLAEATVFAVLAVSAAKIAAAGGDDGPDASFVSWALGLPGGQVLVGAAGIGVLVLAGFAVRRGVVAGFRRHLDLGRVGPRLGRLGILCGRIGWPSLGLAYATAGVLMVVAAVRFDPAQPAGLDAGFKALAAQPYGPALLFVLAAGLAVFGLYCFFDARCRRM